MAESWINEDGKENQLSIKEALKSFDNSTYAYEFAFDYAHTPNEIGLTPEYGVSLDVLVKDNSEVNLTE